MSFTFRNLFSEEDGGTGAAGDRTAQPGQPGRGEENVSSQGAAVTAQRFQVNELLPFIPPAISAESGIPMEKEVAIPLPTDGSGDVALSTLYQVVPELFAAEITPLNDSKVTLPVKISGSASVPRAAGIAIGKADGASSFSGAGAGGSSATLAGESAGADSVRSSPDTENPFWSPDTEDGEETPDAAADQVVQAAGVKVEASSTVISSRPAGKASGSDPSQSGSAATVFGSPAKGGANPFGGLGGVLPGSGEGTETPPAGFQAPEAKDQGEPFGGEEPEPETAGATGFGSGANPFADFTPPESLSIDDGESGISAQEDSAGASFGGTFFDDAVKPEESPGSLEKKESGGNPFESNEDFATLFSRKAEEDSDIPFPIPGDAAKDSWGAMFDEPPVSEDSPASEESQDNLNPVETGFGNMLKQQEARAASKAKKGAPAPSDETPEFPPAGEEETTVEIPSGFHGFGDAGATVFRESPVEAEIPSREEVAPPPSPEKPPEAPSEPFHELPLEDSPTASGFTGFPESEEKEESSEAAAISGNVWSEEAVARDTEEDDLGLARAKAEPDPVEEEKEPVEESVEEEPFSKESPAIVSLHEEEETVAPPASSPDAGEVSDESLRDLELRAIFSTDESFTLSRVARRVVGLEGIHGCALATPTRMVQASKNEQSRLEDEAKEMVGTIRNLAKLTGLPEARSFTLHTDKGTVSLFLEGECCVTVHHDSGAFGPGVREKLILIARSIHKLEE